MDSEGKISRYYSEIIPTGDVVWYTERVDDSSSEETTSSGSVVIKQTETDNINKLTEYISEFNAQKMREIGSFIRSTHKKDPKITDETDLRKRVKKRGRPSEYKYAFIVNIGKTDPNDFDISDLGAKSKNQEWSFSDGKDISEAGKKMGIKAGRITNELRKSGIYRTASGDTMLALSLIHI